VSQEAEKGKAAFPDYDSSVRSDRLVLALAAVLALSCGRAVQAPPPAPTAAPAAVSPAAPAYVPGLGELMAFQQMRHAKLWFAVQSGNWQLAQYEVDELKEGFDTVARLHPTQKGSPVPIDQAIESIVKSPLEKLGDAIGKKDRRAFADAYDTLTEGCNACHQATDHGFNVVQRPKSNTFSNQSFEPPR